MLVTSASIAKGNLRQSALDNPMTFRSEPDNRFQRSCRREPRRNAKPSLPAEVISTAVFAEFETR
jgi:hypothetical protein